MSENFRKFWQHRGGPAGFERWRLTGRIPSIEVKVEWPGFTGCITITDTVQTADRGLGFLLGRSESEARRLIAQRGWKATIIKQGC